MSKQDKTIAAIFHDPPSSNIHWRDVESLLNHLNAEIVAHGAQLHVTVNGVEGMLHRPHHGATLNKAEIRHLREFLAACGVS